MRLDKFVSLNEGRSKKVSEDFVRDFLERRGNEAVKGTLMYRGVGRYQGDYLYINPSEFDARISPYAHNNFYNLLLSNLPSWKNYPKRNKSIICTTDMDNAKGRGDGDAYIVIPRNGAKIGVCSKEDIWISFEFVDSLNDINWSLEDFFENTIFKEEGYYTPDDLDRNYNEFVKACKFADTIKNKYEFPSFYDWLKPYFLNKDMKLLDFLNKTLDPKRNGFKLKKTGDDLFSRRETWTNSDCVLIKRWSPISEEFLLNY